MWKVLPLGIWFACSLFSWLAGWESSLGDGGGLYGAELYRLSDIRHNAANLSAHVILHASLTTATSLNLRALMKNL